MANVLVVGTIALDYIGSYESSFASLSKASDLNISLSLNELSPSFGGCAVNIAVGMQKLGHASLPFALVGREFDEAYRKHLKNLEINLEGLIALPDYKLSSQCFIVTDKAGNQFTAFYPGPSRDSSYSVLLEEFVRKNAAKIDCVILAPDIGANMLTGIEICQKFKLPFFTDPGQCLNDFSIEQTVKVVEQSTVLVVNRHEYELLLDRHADIGAVPVLIRTLGEHGVDLQVGRKTRTIEAVKANRVVDPTGCGDAFRAGLVHGRLHGQSWENSCKIATALASIAIESTGTQSYSTDQLKQRVYSAWGIDVEPKPLKNMALVTSNSH